MKMAKCFCIIVKTLDLKQTRVELSIARLSQNRKMYTLDPTLIDVLCALFCCIYQNFLRVGPVSHSTYNHIKSGILIHGIKIGLLVSIGGVIT